MIVAMMLPCPGCRRFVRETTTSCPFCAQAISQDRAPMGGFFGVLLGVSLSACGGGDGDDTGSASNSSTMSTTTSATEDGTSSEGGSNTQGTSSSTTDDSSSGGVPGPLYGPVSDSSTSDTDASSDSGSSGDSTDSSGSGDSTDSSGGMASDSVGPLYGPATGG
jgi:hypothetical protein